MIHGWGDPNTVEIGKGRYSPGFRAKRFGWPSRIGWVASPKPITTMRKTF